MRRTLGRFSTIRSENLKAQLFQSGAKIQYLILDSESELFRRENSNVATFLLLVLTGLGAKIQIL